MIIQPLLSCVRSYGPTVFLVQEGLDLDLGWLRAVFRREHRRRFERWIHRVKMMQERGAGVGSPRDHQSLLESLLLWIRTLSLVFISRHEGGVDVGRKHGGDLAGWVHQRNRILSFNRLVHQDLVELDVQRLCVGGNKQTCLPILALLNNKEIKEADQRRQ